MRKLFASVVSASLILILAPSHLFAQVPVTVLNNAGDQSLNSLGWAVTTLNNASGGSIEFQIPSNPPVTLTAPLPSSSQHVTFLGPSVNLIAQSGSQGILAFQQNFILGSNFNFSLSNDGSGLGLDAAVTAGSWIVGDSASALVDAGDGSTVNTTGGSGETGGNGGNASIMVGTLTMDNSLNAVIQGGLGGDVFDDGGDADQGGVGGNASLIGNSMGVTSADFVLRGGVGGAVIDATGTDSTGGNGGSASVSLGGLVVSPGALLEVVAGQGGTGNTGGDGGQASATFGSFALNSGIFKLFGGAGRDGDSFGGSGGDTAITFNSVTVDQTSNLQVFAGSGGSGDLGAANGGTVSMTGGSADLGGTFSTIRLLGGNGGSMGSSSGTYDGGNGGNASVSLTTLTSGIGAIFNIQGGSGGSGSEGTNGGDGGLGGNTSMSLGTFTMGVTTQLDILGGSGGAGGLAVANGTGGAGGNGGDLSATVGNLILGDGSNLNLIGGAGGNGGSFGAAGGMGGDGADGGSVSLVAAAVTLASGTSLSVNGGAKGFAGFGGVDGTQGDSAVSIGALNGTGVVNVSGDVASLRVGSGSFGGILAGSVALQKTGFGILVLSGGNTYSGGTTVSTGDVWVDGGGSLGLGAVVNNNGLFYMNGASAGSNAIDNNVYMGFQETSTANNSSINNDGYLYFGDDSTAANSSITTNSVNGLEFTNNSSAGSATITVNSGSNVEFYDSASGGTARFVVNASGTFDISNHTGGMVTVGSIEGAGEFNLGANDFVTGTNNLSSAVSGIVSGTGGSLTKTGAGTLQLITANTYTGGTTLQGGTLEIGNLLALGTGSVAVNGGILSAFSGPQTFQVGDDYSQGSNGTLQMGLGGSGALQLDVVNVTDNAALDGTLNLVEYGGLTAPTIGQSVTMMTAASVNGRFSFVTQTLSEGRLLPAYFSDRVELRSIVTSFENAGLTPNQIAIGLDLDNIYGDARVYDLILGIGTQTDPQLRASYDLMSPAGFSALYQAGFANARSLALQVERHLSALRRPQIIRVSQAEGLSSIPDPSAPEPAPVPSSSSMGDLFLLGDGGVFSVKGDGNGPGYKASSFGVAGAGVDFRFSKNFVGGVILGYHQTDVTVDDGGVLTAGGGQLGFYGSLNKDGFYLQGLAEGGLNGYTTSRVGVNGTAQGTTGGIQFSGSLGTGYDWKMGKVTMGPFGFLQYTRVEMDAFNENGSDGPLSFSAQGADSLASRLGLRAAGRFKMGELFISPDIRLGWQREFSDQGGSVRAGFGAGDSFSVDGARVGQSGFLVGASLEVRLPGNIEILANYQGELGREGMDSQRFGGGVQLGL